MRNAFQDLAYGDGDMNEIADVITTLIDRFTGNWFEVQCRGHSFLPGSLPEGSDESTWLLDCVANRLSKDMMFDGKSPYEIVRENNVPKLWVLARQGFSMDVLGANKRPARELFSGKNFKVIRWMFNQQLSNESAPTEEEISSCHEQFYNGFSSMRFVKHFLSGEFDRGIQKLKEKILTKVSA